MMVMTRGRGVSSTNNRKDPQKHVTGGASPLPTRFLLITGAKFNGEPLTAATPLTPPTHHVWGPPPSGRRASTRSLSQSVPRRRPRRSQRIATPFSSTPASSPKSRVPAQSLARIDLGGVATGVGPKIRLPSQCLPSVPRDVQKNCGKYCHSGPGRAQTHVAPNAAAV